ncbi:GH32 C-terminal domain-containing protein [Paenibacillus thailandensis]|uniref:GH32 C-terminal domain-containing protein n=1 Tax=Paenibacillus thailandensis TaxID=393250 RepID=A0ABW5QSJ1_9BACL
MNAKLVQCFSVLMTVLLVTFSAAAAAVLPTGGRNAEAAALDTNTQTEEGPAIFESASNIHTNLTGWQVRGAGRMEATQEGLLLTSDEKENVMAISGVASDNFIYEADVKVIDPEADATLVFRSNADGWASYMLQIVPNAQLIRLRDAAGDSGLKEERQVALHKGEIYHLKVIADGSSLKVYWDGRYKPIIDVKDAAYAKGLLGLNVYNGSALFQNIKVSELNANLGSTASKAGEWEPDLKGLEGRATDEPAVQVFDRQGTDIVYEGDIAFDEGQSEAALAFRMSSDGSAGYLAALVKDGDGIAVQLKKADGTVIAASARIYPSLQGVRHHLEIIAKGNRITVFVDGYGDAAVQAADNSYAQGYAGLAVLSGHAYFQNVYMTASSDYYTEKYRPDYHYTPARGSASDPNGLVYYEGEYHLFHQDGGTWAHAVSEDLVHWKRLPTALPWNELGHVWSGSAVADLNNDSGLFGGSGGSGLLAYYTSYNPDAYNGNQRIGLAYSTDRGRTWHYSKEHPIVIDNPGKQGEDPGGWDFRDPKVVRDEANGRWVMVVSGGDHIRFYTSTNLISWTFTDSFGYGDYVRGGVWECPDLFELTVEGSAEKKWVLMISTGANPATQGSDAEYFVGQLTAEGKFINDNPAGKVLKTDYGKEFYASMSFSNMPDNRRIMIAWMTNWDYPFAFPTVGWKGQLTVPREVKLRNTGDGPRLVQAPIQELGSLRSKLFQSENLWADSQMSDPLAGLTSGAYEIEAEIEIPADSSATEIGFNVREGANGDRTTIGYRIAEQRVFIDRSLSGATDFSSLFSTLHEAPLQPAANRIKMNILVDESSVEAFANDGEVVFSDVIFPDPASLGMSFYAEGGPVKIISLRVHALADAWNDRDEAAAVVMDTSARELSVGQSDTLYAAIDGKRSALDDNEEQLLQWNSSDSSIARIVSAGNGQATVQAEGEGEAVITVSTRDGRASASAAIRVYDGEFVTNLTGWKRDRSSSSWITTKDGIRGSYASDANYVARETAGNFIYEADMTLGSDGGAGSILFRASEDGRSGYYFNLDPNMKAFRLFYKIGGYFEDRMVIGRVPAFIQRGTAYHVKIEANGPHIQIYVNGQSVIDVMDGTFAEGHFGVNVFGGQAVYQNVQATDRQEAGLTSAVLSNEASGRSLYAAENQNGEPVTVHRESLTAWVFVPTGDEHGSYSIRMEGGKALDLNTSENKIQLYDYLGYNNQRWVVKRNENGTATITSVHNGKALEVSEDGTALALNDPIAGLDRQQWSMSAELR